MSLYVDGLARLAWIQLWQVAVVALLVGAVARLCCRNRPRLAYALWMLVVVKSIVPPVWSSPVGLFSCVCRHRRGAARCRDADKRRVGQLAGNRTGEREHGAGHAHR